MWLKSREPLQVSAPWPVAAEEGSYLALDNETPIAGMAFTVRVRCPAVTPRSVATLRLSKIVDGRRLTFHSENVHDMELSDREFTGACEILVREGHFTPDMYELEIFLGRETVADRKVQIIARPPYVPRGNKPDDSRSEEPNTVAPASVADAVRAVHQGIVDKHWPNIEKACRGAKEIHADTEVVQMLMSLLDDADENTRRLVFQALYHLGPTGEPAVPAMVEALEVPELRQGACQALGSIGPAAAPAVPRLIELFHDESNRHNVLTALRGIGAPAREALPLLVERLRVPRDDVNFVPHELKRCFAAIGTDAVPPITELLSDTDPATRRRAAIVLEHMGPTAVSAVPRLMASLDDSANRDWAAAALGRMGTASGPAVPRLVRLLESNDFTVRACAARSLGEIGPASKAALPALKGRLRDTEHRVRVAAGEAIHGIESVRAVDPE
jgi:HEAT repeat protein